MLEFGIQGLACGHACQVGFTSFVLQPVCRQHVHMKVPHSLYTAGPALAGLPDADAIRDQLPKGGNPAEKVKEQVSRTGPQYLCDFDAAA